MCGRYNITDDEPMRRLIARLGLQKLPRPQLNVPPGAIGEIVIETDQGRELREAVWSMLIEPKPDGAGYRPDPKYTTFNAQSRRLTTSPLWKRHYRHHRAILPVSGFHEWQGSPGHKQCMDIHGTGDHHAMALACLYQEWHFGNEAVTSFAVITLPPHPRFEHVHAKSIPLMLESQDFDAWLDPHFEDINAFNDLMGTHIPFNLEVVPVRSPQDLQPVAEGELIAAD